MRRPASVLIAALVAAVLAWLSSPAPAQIPGTANIQVGGTNIVGGTNGRCLYDNNGKIGETASCGLAGGITIGTSVISGGTNGRIFYDNSAVVGEAVTGTGVLTALGVNVGSAGAFVTFNGALGTPLSGSAVNLTGLPIAGITGLGTNQPTFLAAALTVNGALKLNGSGTPSQAASSDLSDSGGWTPYIPTMTCASGSATWANTAGRYKTYLANTTVIAITATMSNAGTCAGAITASLPNTSANQAVNYWLVGREVINTGNLLAGQIGANATVTTIAADAAGVPIGSGNIYRLGGTYENQ